MAEPLRVTAVIKGLGPGGAERLLVAAARATDPREVGFTVIHALAHKDHLVGDLRAAGATVQSLGVRRLGDPRWTWRLVWAVRSSRPDVVHVHSPALAPFVRLAARLGVLGRRRPAVVNTEHNAWPTYHPLTRGFDAATARLDDLTLTVSEEVRASLRPARLRDRARTVRHGIDLAAVRAHRADRDRVRRDLGVSDDEVLAVTVANYRAQKNYPLLLRAARTVLHTVPLARFVAVGQGPLAATIAGLHHELGLGDRFRLLGYRPDAVSVLAAADAFVLASDYEGLPVALMEALALGLPVVATRVGGVAETVGPDAGRLVAPGDQPALEAALLAVVTDAALRGALAEGAAALGDSFDARRTAAELTAHYREVIGRVRR